ncbi:MAG TPA: hypothetical protein VNN10_12935 [Dehalococcoidia bacterium]|nr:hypothetical protein [Dehalococcoidia bacterium]
MKYGLAAGAVAAVLLLAFTCESVGEETGCSIPQEDSIQGKILAEGRREAAFDFLYPCRLPNSQRLTNISVVGASGRQSVTLTFEGPFEINIYQSQTIPVASADPAGASHIVLRNLFPGIDADLIEINEGARKAQYRLVWRQGGMYYEIAAAGPPLQRRTILEIARSLQ